MESLRKELETEIKEKELEIDKITEQKNKDLKAMRMLLEQKPREYILKETGLSDEQLEALIQGK